MDTENSDQDAVSMCSICHTDPPVNAVELNCRHVFCYLCIKSVLETTGVCALCRSEIGSEFNFQDHDISGPMKLPTASSDGCYWFYEGHRGWWLYDAETNRDIESAYQRGDTQCEKFIAGSIYIINFSTMKQHRKDEVGGRQRQICRATLELDNILGLAGLKGQDLDQSLELMRCTHVVSYVTPSIQAKKNIETNLSQ